MVRFVFDFLQGGLIGFSVCSFLRDDMSAVAMAECWTKEGASKHGLVRIDTRLGLVRAPGHRDLAQCRSGVHVHVRLEGSPAAATARYVDLLCRQWQSKLGAKSSLGWLQMTYRSLARWVENGMRASLSMSWLLPPIGLLTSLRYELLPGPWHRERSQVAQFGSCTCSIPRWR